MNTKTPILLTNGHKQENTVCLVFRAQLFGQLKLDKQTRTCVIHVQSFYFHG